MRDTDELEWAYKRLELIGNRLKLVSLYLLTATVLNLSIIFCALGKVIYIYNPFVTVLTLIATFNVFFMALWFDTLRKDGKSYYDEISGVLHATSKNENNEFHDSSIMARVAVRKFMNSYEIPLIPGKFGPGLIVVINVLIVVFWATMSFNI